MIEFYGDNQVLLKTMSSEVVHHLPRIGDTVWLRPSLLDCQLEQDHPLYDGAHFKVVDIKHVYDFVAAFPNTIEIIMEQM